MGGDDKATSPLSRIKPFRMRRRLSKMKKEFDSSSCIERENKRQKCPSKIEREFDSSSCIERENKRQNESKSNILLCKGTYPLESTQHNIMVFPTERRGSFTAMSA